jgi:hypothetical protein
MHLPCPPTTTPGFLRQSYLTAGRSITHISVEFNID